MPKGISKRRKKICGYNGIASQEPAVTVREARESKSNKNRIEKILKKWMSLACDFVIKIFRRIFYFLIFIGFLAKQLRLSDDWNITNV